MQYPKRPLLRALKSAARVVPTRSSLPILECLLIRDHKVTASDLAITVEIPLPGLHDPNTPAFAVNAHDFISAIDKMPGDEIQLVFSDQTETSAGVVAIKSGKARVTLQLDHPDDFPTPPKAETAKPVQFTAERLQTICNMAVCHIDDIRQWTNGTCLTGSTAVVTDGHRLVTTPLEEPIETPLIIPTKVWKMIEAIGISDATLTGNTFELQDGRIHFKAIEAKFPDYTAVIPKAPKNTVKFIVQELKDALKVVMVATNKSTFQIEIKVKEPNIAVVSAEDMDFHKEASVECQISTNCQPGYTFAFNGIYLQQMLEFLPDSHTVEIKANATSQPHIFEAADHEGQVLLMPIMPKVHY